MKPRSAADRLRGLQRLLTWLLTAINAAGLVVFAWLAVNADTDRGTRQLDGDNHRVTSTVLRLLQFDTTVVTAYVGPDEINDQCPQFAILQGGSGAFPSYYSARTCVPAAPAVLGGRGGGGDPGRGRERDGDRGAFAGAGRPSCASSLRAPIASPPARWPCPRTTPAR